MSQHYTVKLKGRNHRPDGTSAKKTSAKKTYAKPKPWPVRFAMVRLDCKEGIPSGEELFRRIRDRLRQKDYFPTMADVPVHPKSIVYRVEKTATPKVVNLIEVARSSKTTTKAGEKLDVYKTSVLIPDALENVFMNVDLSNV